MLGGGAPESNTHLRLPAIINFLQDKNMCGIYIYIYERKYPPFRTKIFV